MRRFEVISISLPKGLIDEIDRAVSTHRYRNRSDFMRKAAKRLLMEVGEIKGDSEYIAVFVVTYSFEEMDVWRFSATTVEHGDVIVMAQKMPIHGDREVGVILAKGEGYKIKTLIQTLNSVKGIDHIEKIIVEV